MLFVLRQITITLLADELAYITIDILRRTRRFILLRKQEMRNALARVRTLICSQNTRVIHGFAWFILIIYDIMGNIFFLWQYVIASFKIIARSTALCVFYSETISCPKGFFQ